MRTADEHGALPTVLAEPALSSAGYRRRWAAEWVRERFWVIPAVLLVAGTGLVVLTTEGTGIRSPITRVAFGTLLAAFAYSVTSLVLSHGRSGPATSRAVTVAAALEAISLVVFLRYVAAMMELLQVVDVISAVARETKAAVAASWLPSPNGRLAGCSASTTPGRPNSPAATTASSS